MSAQGATLERRGAVHVPIWPVAAVLVAMIATAIGMSVLSGGTETQLVTRVTDEERFANSSAAIREQGAMPIGGTLQENPGMWTLSQAEAYLRDLAVLEGSTAAVREQGAVLPVGATVNPGMWTIAQAEAYLDGLVTFIHGLENPGAYVTRTTTQVVGLENPGAYPIIEGGPFTPKAGAHRPIEVNGRTCGQCR